MKITLNGNIENFKEQVNIYQLLKLLDLQNKRLAVEVNQEIVPMANHQNHILNHGDKVEIVNAIGGG